MADKPRRRFFGFNLGRSKRDRLIAHWLDTTPGNTMIIKDLIWRHINQVDPPPAPISAPSEVSASSLLNSMED